MKSLVPAAFLLLTGCAALPPAERAGDHRIYPCYGETRDWRAWIDAMPGTGGPWLNVTGTVTTPTGGHRTFLTLGATTRSEPPQQFVHLNIQSQGDVATTMVVTEEVSGRFPALPRYGAVVILCNGQEVGRVTQVNRAH